MLGICHNALGRKILRINTIKISIVIIKRFKLMFCTNSFRFLKLNLIKKHIAIQKMITVKSLDLFNMKREIEDFEDSFELC